MRQPTAWVFYWLGEIVHYIMMKFDWASRVLYPVYNWLMNASSYIQGDGNGPWQNVQSPEK